MMQVVDFQRIFNSSGFWWICLEMPKLAWGARGSEFESRHADQFFPMKSTGYIFKGVARFSLRP
jgi:hypothetical protein